MHKPVFLLLFLTFIFLISCTQKNQQTLCCQDCLAASQQDPSGYDISIKPCLQYQLNDQCRQFFAENPLIVQDCGRLVE